MQEFIVNAPIQTRQNSLHKHERLLSFLSAEALNKIAEFQTGSQLPRVDLWNTVGTKSEKDWAEANAIQPISYVDYHHQQIQSRYDILENYGIDRSARKVLTDGGEQYCEIVRDNIRKRVDNGDFVVKKEKFTHCEPCDYIVAPVGAGIDKCPVCHEENLDQVETEGLFTSIDDKKRREIIDNTDIHPEMVRKSLRRTVLTMSDSIQLSKQRQVGIRLSEFGIDEKFVLDPKISLAMMGRVVKEMGLGQIKAFVQGVDSVGNLAPYVYIADPEGQYSYVNIGLVPTFNKDILNDKNKPFYSTYLPLIMMSHPNGIDVQQRLNIFKEFNRTCGQYRYVTSSVNELLTNETVEVDRGLQFSNQEIFGLFNQYKIQEGLTQIRQFIYEGLSRDYLNCCRNNGTVPQTKALKQLKDVFSLTYNFKGDQYPLK